MCEECPDSQLIYKLRAAGDCSFGETLGFGAECKVTHGLHT